MPRPNQIGTVRHFFIAFLFQACLLGIVCSQVFAGALATTKQNPPLTGISHTKWTQRDGLPGSDIRRIVQTLDGYLWFTTEAGLVRFDGARFTPMPLPGISFSGTGGLCASSDGGLWVGLVPGGIVHIHDGSITYYPPGNGLTDGQVRTIVQDRRGAIWVGTPIGISRFQDQHWQNFGAANGFPGHRVTSILEDHSGIVWLGSSTGIFRWDAATNRFLPELKATKYVDSLSEDSHGVIWVSEEGHPLRALHDNRKLPQWKGGTSILEDHRGNIWIRSYWKGLVRISPAAPHQLQQFTVKEGLSSDFVECIFEDREGNIWIGTQNGLNRLRQINFSAIPNHEIADHFIRDLSIAQDGRLWTIVTPNLYRVSKGAVTLVASPFEGRESTFSVNSAQPLLLAGSGRVAQLRGEQFRPLFSPKSGPPELIFDVARDASGGLWMVDNGAGLVRWYGGTFSKVPMFAGKNARRALVDRQGRVWVGAQDGLWELDRGNWRHYTKADGVRQETINVLYEDKDHEIWTAAADTISHLQDNSFVSFSPGLATGSITSILKDDTNALWLVHTSGIVRIAATEWARASRDPQYHPHYRKFDESDGLPALPPATQGHFAARGTDGKLWFALRNGVVSVDPHSLFENQMPPPIRIEEAIVDQKIIHTSSGARLPPHSRSLEIHYTALSLVAAEKVRFRVKLEGFDSDWVDSGDRRQMFYTNLAPGTYRFRVVACNNDGVWNETGDVWEFSVAKALYQTTWFMVLALFAGTMMIWGIYVLRIRQIEARNRVLVEERVAERTRVARELHDTLLQNMVGLSLEMGGLAKTVACAQDRKRLQDFQRQLDTSLQDIRQSVSDLRCLKLETSDVMTALRRWGKAITRNKAICFNVIVEGRPWQIPAQMQQQILRIGQEAINNAVRHAQASQIQVRFSFEEYEIRLRIADDGRGFLYNVATLPQGHWGIVNMRERASQIGGELTITSTPGHGTEVEAVFFLSLLETFYGKTTCADSSS